MPISVNDIVRSLHQAGVQRGDTACVHSFIGAFGQFSIGQKSALQVAYDAIREALGPEGTLVIPTFNYDFCGGAVYDHENTPSVLGQFSEYCRCHPEAKRALHPVYSHVVFGKDTNFYLNQPSPEAFGADSIFGRLHKKNALIVGFGVTFNSLTFFHYIEAQMQVPYRFMKVFSGQVKEGKRTYAYSAPIYSRYLELDPRPEFGLLPLQKKFTKQGLVKSAELERGEVFSIRAQDLYEASVFECQKNSMCFLKAPVNLAQIERGVTP